MCILWRSQYCRWFETSWNSLLRSGYVACIQLTHTGTYLYEPEKTLVSSWDKFTRRLEFKYHFIIIIIQKWRIRDVNIQHLSFLWDRRKGECQTLTGVDPPSTTGVSTLEGLQWNRCTILSFVDFTTIYKNLKVLKNGSMNNACGAARASWCLGNSSMAAFSYDSHWKMTVETLRTLCGLIKEFV